jgi:hypothetical protein
MQDAWPKPQIIRLPADGDAPQILLDNAGQLALALLSMSHKGQALLTIALVNRSSYG